MFINIVSSIQFSDNFSSMFLLMNNSKNHFQLIFTQKHYDLPPLGTIFKESMIFAYVRASTNDQGLDINLKKLKEYNCNEIYQEKVSGVKTIVSI